MIWQIDSSKIPDKNIAFIAEAISISYKNNCTIDETLEEMKDVLRKK